MLVALVCWQIATYRDVIQLLRLTDKAASCVVCVLKLSRILALRIVRMTYTRNVIVAYVFQLVSRHAVSNA